VGESERRRRKRFFSRSAPGAAPFRDAPSAYEPTHYFPAILPPEPSSSSNPAHGASQWRPQPSYPPPAARILLNLNEKGKRSTHASSPSLTLRLGAVFLYSAPREEAIMRTSARIADMVRAGCVVWAG